MNEYFTKVLQFFSFDVLVGRSWLDFVTILTPSVILIVGLFYLSVIFIKFQKWRIAAYGLCVLLTFVYLPYELIRQSTALARADANVKELQSNLHELLNTANLNHLQSATNQELSTEILDELIRGLEQDRKKDLLLVSWAIAENGKNALHQINDSQKSFADGIKSDLNKTKAEIIESRPPIEKISDSIVKRLDSDIDKLVETKMQSFRQEIDQSLDNFRDNINAFVQRELGTYQEKLAAITQQNVDELRSYSNKANQAFAEQVNKLNRESLQKMEATKKSIDGIGATIADVDLKNVAQQIKLITASIDRAQKKTDILFEYNECMRTAGVLDLAGKEENCKTKLNQSMGGLK